MPDPPAQMRQWDQRPDTSESPQKGLGFLGMFKLPNGVASEYSIAESEHLKDQRGNYMDYPSLVPTLTRDEVQAVLRAATQKIADPKSSPSLPDSVYDKAEAWALRRRAEGKPFFAQPGEQYPLYSDIPRVSVQTTSGDIALPPGSQRDPRLGKLGYEDVEHR